MQSAPGTAGGQDASPAKASFFRLCWRSPSSLHCCWPIVCLLCIGYEPALAAEIGRFLGAIAWAAPGFLGFAVLRSFLVAASHSRTVMIALILCIPMNAGLNWILVFGHLGAPALGIAGSGCSTAIVQWLMFTGLGLYAFAAPSLAQYRMRP